MIGIFSAGILRTSHLESFLLQSYRRQRSFLSPAGIDSVAGWGLKSTASAARAYAARHGLPYIALEDGFLRSVGLGVAGHAPCSMVFDDIGIYYDASRPSRLENLIRDGGADGALLEASRQALALIRQHRLSKYNHAPSDINLNLPAGRKILVVDQTAGDMSVVSAAADAVCFKAMLEAAIAENPGASILVKTHPDVLSGKKRGYLTGLADDRRIVCLTADCNPAQLIEQVDQVYVVTSHMGFEALMLGKPVVTFGLPWYACWGLTDDRNEHRAILDSRRCVPRTVEQLFGAAYIQYTRYIDPDTGCPGTIFDVIRHLAEGKRRNDESRGTVYCVGMNLWKKAVVKPFLTTPSTKVKFVRTAAQIPRDDRQARMLVWGRKDEVNPAIYAMPGMTPPVVRMEDGFLRSVGLGSNLRRPLSLVVDTSGIYYDPRTPSALEQWLQGANLLPIEQERAAKLRARLVALKLSKYNVGLPYAPSEAAQGRRVLLVVGQVEGDASLRYGSPEIWTNAALLARVREENPDAYLIYKPHPDVVAGNRDGAVGRSGAVPASVTPWDELVIEANIIDCIMAADEIHTMTSQSGFEALLYGKTVHCYGRPFYSGWGLTTDHAKQSCRGRTLNLDTLVYGALVHYPRYIDPVSLRQVSVEHVVNALESSRPQGGGHLVKTGYVARQCYKAIEIWRTLR